MQTKYSVKYSPVAVDDMDEIFSYISEDSVHSANTMLMKLDHQIKLLADFLNRGSVLSDEEYTLIQRGYRFIVVHPYLVFYRILNHNTVVIHRILHGRRDYLRELFNPLE